MTPNMGEILDARPASYPAATAITANSVVITGTAGATLGGTTKHPAIRAPITAASTSLCYLGYARGKADAAGDIIPVEINPGYMPSGTGGLGTGLGTEIPVGVALGSGAIGDLVSVARVGQIAYVTAGAAIASGARVGASGTIGRVVTI